MDDIKSTITLTIYALAAVSTICGFVIGKLHERTLWNNLIKQGKLHTPQGVYHDKASE